MYRFIETVRIKDCQINNLKYHIDRFERTRKKFFTCYAPIDLKEIILHEIEKNRLELNREPEACRSIKENPEGIRKTFKCRIVYSENIESVEILPYTVKKISSLKTVICNDIDYSVKSADRDRINYLFSMKGECDDILIIRKGLVTDTSFANVLFSDSDKLYTPAAPLLKGTMREKLIDENKVSVINIKIDDIKSFQYITLINAMMDPGQIKIPVDNIVIK
jgi:4-amino-4-deoxychorismate lyase